MRISDWSSDVCSSDLHQDMAACSRTGVYQRWAVHAAQGVKDHALGTGNDLCGISTSANRERPGQHQTQSPGSNHAGCPGHWRPLRFSDPAMRSEEHTSELQSLMRISYAVFCLKKTTNPPTLNI